jgi:uncharacterized protein YfaS (alpha-2-macroglobulin family)
MKIHLRLFIALMAISLISSCTLFRSEGLKLKSPLPKGIIANNAVFEFQFSRAVVPRDSTLTWTSTPYVEFSPGIEGKFVWQDTAKLIFSPDTPLPGDTKFSGRLNVALLLKLSDARSFSGDDEFTFATEPFRLKGAEFFYDRIDNKRRVGVKANLEFTYLVNPDDVSKYLKILIEKAPHTSFTVVSPVPSRVIAVEIGELTQLEKEQDIAVSLDPELVSPETRTHITMEKPFTYRLPGLAELKIFGHQFGFDGKESWIMVKTSQEIDLQSVKPLMEISPARELRVEQGDGPGFMLRGKMEPGSQFHLVIKKGIESILGAKTQNDYEADIIIGNVKPSFRFASSAGTYMLLGGQKGIDIITVNMGRLQVRVSQIFENNLVHFLDQGRSYDYDYSYDEEEGGGYTQTRKYRYQIGNYGRTLGQTTVDLANVVNQEVTTFFDLAPYIRTDYRGFYLVEIANPSDPWRTTSKLISISDIGLIVKQNKDAVNVFAVSLETTDPLAGVKIDLISTNNQTIGSKQTDGEGRAHFAKSGEISPGFALKLVTARKADDFNFINLTDYEVETSRFDVGGKKGVPSGYDAFLYGDRNIYRPGEKIILSGIVRPEEGELQASMPVRIKVYNPQGTEVSELQRTLNEQGSFEIVYPTQLTAPTGEYRFDLRTGDGGFLSSYKVNLEDFVPDRLRVYLKADQETAKPGDKIKYDLQAFNFFGPPAAGRKLEFEGTFSGIPFYSDRYPEFRFADAAAADYSAAPVVMEGETDSEGKAEIEFPIPANVTARGLLRARGRAAVFDESGRPVYQTVLTTVYPKTYFIGILNKGAYYISPNTPQTIQIVAVDEKDNPIDAFKARVEVIRKEWHSVLRMHQRTNTLRYVSEQREIVEQSKEMTLSAGPTPFTYSVQRSGDYVVRVSKSGDKGYNQFGFYAYSWGSTDITSFEVNPDARIDIVADKKTYEPGERAKILFQCPFDGKLLATVERNEVISYRYLDVTKNSAAMEIDVSEQFLPNVYISAVLFRKVKGQNLPLMTGHGFAPLMVEKKSNRLDIVINAPEKMRPKRTQKVTVVVPDEENVFLTLAAVDEGVLQVKNFSTPNPYGYFYMRKALDVSTYDFFRDLIPEPVKRSGTSSNVGGDEEAELSLRASPFGVQRFKPLALWSGILRTGANGQAEVTLDVPEFSGELRLMAVAYKGRRYGSAQKAMKVADPVVITPGLPRFMSPNDMINMPITAFNTTDKKVSLTFAIQTEGPVTPLQSSATLEVGPNQERVVSVRLKSTEQVGKAVVRVTTEAFGEKLESVTEIPVRPISPFVTESIVGVVEGGKSVRHDLEDVFLPYGRRAHLVLSPFPVVNFAKQLKHLVGYPHGCIEQTTSKAFPQIYLRDIALLLDPSILEHGSPTYFVNEAITKLGTMQMEDGNFAYWPGGNYSSPWSTVYATHFLVEAKKAGYTVPEALLKSALNALARIARSSATYDYVYTQNNKTAVKRIADKSVVYALYVLAAAGQPETNVMNFYRTARSLLATDTRYLLGGAFALSGDRKSYVDIIPGQFEVEEAVRTTGYCFDSPLRANALILNVLLETDPLNLNIARYMDYLSRSYEHTYWYSTQDNAFTLLAFGKAARLSKTGKMTGTVTIDGKQQPYDGGNKKYDIGSPGRTVAIELKGEGRVYYSLVMEGIRKDGKVRIEDKNLRVRREFFDRNGSAVDLQAVRANSVVIVKLTLAADFGGLQNVAISDLLPGGFEVENPRLTETGQYRFISKSDVPTYVDIRDDRINFYTNFERSERQRVFYYVVRAVTRGEFQYAPVVAETMYDGNYYSASGLGTVKIID